MSRRLSCLVVAAALLASACNTQLGREIPDCDPSQVSSAIIISAQSVRGTAYVPCLNDLQPGWEYEHLQARRGQTRFWLNSDRVGEHFLEVTLEPDCDTAGASEAVSDEVVPLFVDEVEADYQIGITIVPEGEEPETHVYAQSVARELNDSTAALRGIEAVVDSSDVPTADRIGLALGRDRVVLVVGPRELEEGTVELHRRPGARGDREVLVAPDLDLAAALEAVAEGMGDPEYRAFWYYPFGSGCVTYRFDARGPGVEQLVGNVRDAIGLFDLGPLREFGEQVGYVVP